MTRPTAGARRALVRTGFALGLVVHTLTAQPLQTLDGGARGDAYGLSVRSAGDVDKDGVVDHVVGAPGGDGNGTDSGMAVVYSGVDDRVLYRFRGATTAEKFGYAVDGAGDVNGDGYADVIIGAPYANSHNDKGEVYENTGSAQVFSGRDGKILHSFAGDSIGDALGWSVAGVGDLDRDGHAEVAVGAPFHDHKGKHDVGMVSIRSGKTGVELYRLLGHGAGDRFGWAIASTGDVDRDRCPDLLVGVEGSSWREAQAGSVQLFSGKRGRLLRTLRSGQEEDYFGTAVTSTGDIDGDGRDDFLVGAWNGEDEEQLRTGTATVFSGRSGAVLLTVSGSAEHDRFGAAVTAIGDADGDGHPDFAVGAPQEAETGSGYVRAFSGATGAILFTLVGDQIGDALGTSICTTRDRNADGTLDLVVGAPGMRARGACQVFASRPQ